MIRLPTRPTRTYTLFPHTTLFRTSGGSPCKGGVSPFGHPRIKACSQLPEAFRSVPRPSSPLGAKASTRCPSSLERYFHVPSQGQGRSEEHTSELQSLMRIPYAVFCLKKKKTIIQYAHLTV